MSQPGNFWGSDTPISMPIPSDDDIIIDMGAFGFTQNGLDHNITKAELENYTSPTFSPEEVRGA